MDSRPQYHFPFILLWWYPWGVPPLNRGNESLYYELLNLFLNLRAPNVKQSIRLLTYYWQRSSRRRLSHYVCQCSTYLSFNSEFHLRWFRFQCFGCSEFMDPKPKHFYLPFTLRSGVFLSYLSKFSFEFFDCIASTSHRYLMSYDSDLVHYSPTYLIKSYPFYFVLYWFYLFVEALAYSYQYTFVTFWSFFSYTPDSFEPHGLTYRSVRHPKRLVIVRHRFCRPEASYCFLYELFAPE